VWKKYLWVRFEVHSCISKAFEINCYNIPIDKSLFFRITGNGMTKFTFEIAEKKLKTRFKQNMTIPGKELFSGFVKCHPKLILRKSESKFLFELLGSVKSLFTDCSMCSRISLLKRKLQLQYGQNISHSGAAP